MGQRRWAWLASGDGWRGAGPVPANGAWGVPAAAIVDRLALRLRGDGSDQDAALAKQALATLDAWQGRGLAIVGSWSFELGAALERLPIAAVGRPGPQRFARLDDLVAMAFDPAAVVAVHDAPPTPIGSSPAPPPVPPAAWQRQRAGFVADAARIHAEIAAGRVYQVNLTRAFAVAPALGRAAFAAPAIEVLAALQATQPVPFAAVFDPQAPGRPPHRLISGSMELLLAADRGPDGAMCLRSRPIKGTTPRGGDEVEDAAARRALETSAKERAENAMIVDMARNDLGRLAITGSVEVPTLLQAVPYRTLWHLESEVHAVQRSGVGRAEQLAALMPPASVSGAPKIAAIGTLFARERRRRGAYCGAIGVLWPDGTARLAVAIRVVVVDARGGELAVGAGIVADSSPAAEWQELMLKASASQRWLATIAVRTGRRTARRPQ